MKTRTLIDWISFTTEVGFPEHCTLYDASERIDETMYQTQQEFWTEINFQQGFQQRNGRKQYQISWYHPNGVTIYASPDRPEVLTEISGKGCDWLRKKDLERGLLSAAMGKLTRLDLAIDIECEDQPQDFLKGIISGRFKTVGHFNSPSGNTSYVGSKKSERYARVYRYHDPHPRSKYLRIEYVLRRKMANDFAYAVLLHGLEKTMQVVHEAFGFSDHKYLQDDSEPIIVESLRPERKSSKTLQWLISQVRPAFRRLVDEGIIQNPQEWLNEHFL